MHSYFYLAWSWKASTVSTWTCPQMTQFSSQKAIQQFFPCYSNISKTSSNQQLLSLPNCGHNTCLKPLIKFYMQFLALLLFCSYWIWADLSFQLCHSEQIWNFSAGQAAEAKHENDRKAIRHNGKSDERAITKNLDQFDHTIFRGCCY